jgi:predicted ATP-grasp superfamily ATP-dependent carboligase
MYTGGLENYPRLLQRISQDRPLLGNDARTCYAVRDPERLAVFCQQAGVAFPRMERSPHTLPRDGTWLCKPYRGAGGTRIHRFHGLIPPGPHRTYFQQLVQGASLAMVFLQTAAGVELRGVTRQLVGADWLHSAPFAYCGSVGPVEWPPDLHLRWTRFGTQLAQHFGLKGVFGVDCIQGDDTHWLIEINPRYTASMEILEWALHRGVLGPCAPGSPPSNEVLGKAIYYARNSCRFPAEGPWLDSLRPLPDVWQMPEFADIPRPGTPIEAGQPVLSFYGRAASAAACEEQLRKRAALLDRLLSPG